jgi:hypothetical protein
MSTQPHVANLTPMDAVPSAAQHPFRFLDLPADLRCMVYERIDYGTRHYRLKDPFYKHLHLMFNNDQPESGITLVVKTLSVAVLTSCRLVNQEALPFLAPKLERLRHREAIRYIIDATSFQKYEAIYAALCESMIGGQNADHDIQPSSTLDPSQSLWETGMSSYAPLRKFVRKCQQHMATRTTLATTITIRLQPMTQAFLPPELRTTFHCFHGEEEYAELELLPLVRERELALIHKYISAGKPYTFRRLSDREFGDIWEVEDVVHLN